MATAPKNWYPRENEVLEDRWEIVKKLGAGAFGAVFEVKDRQSYEMAACKVEHINAVVHILKWEVVVMRQLTQSGAVHCTRMLDCGRGPKGDYVYLCMQLVGPNLEKLKEKLPNSQKIFSLRTCLHIGFETLDGIRELHDAGYLHRDIKPENFAIGRPPQNKRVYLLDLGMVRQWRRADGRAFRPRESAAFRGNFKYASVNALHQNEQSRADDLWAWFFQLIDLTSGTLPWPQQMEGADIYEKMKNLALAKERAIKEPGRLITQCPREYGRIQKHLESLRFESEPDYSQIRASISEAFKRKAYTEDMKIDWEEGGEHYEATRMVPNDTRF